MRSTTGLPVPSRGAERYLHTPLLALGLVMHLGGTLRSVLLCTLVGTVILLARPVKGQSGDTTDTALRQALAEVDSLRQAGEWMPARDRLQELRSTYPGRVEVLWRLVYTYADMGRATENDDRRARYYEHALEVAKAGLAADSTSARAHLSMAVAEGRVALDAGTGERIRRSRAVKRHADRAIALDSTLDGAFHVRGRWNREVADLGFFKRAIVKTVYGGLPEASFEQAVRDFNKAIELHDEIFHHLELGKTYLKLDEEDAARSEFQTVLDMPAVDPFDPRYKEEARELLEDME